MRQYNGKVWFIRAPLGHYYRCRACLLTFCEARCRGYYFTDSNNEYDAAWEECCPLCQEPRAALYRTWFAGFFRTRLWRWINSMRPKPRAFE